MFKEKMERRGEKLAEEVREAFSNLNVLDALSNKDWDEVYKGLRFYASIEVCDNRTVLEVSYADGDDDFVRFDLLDRAEFVRDGTEAPRSVFEKMASDFEKCAQIIRDAKHVRET